MIKDRPLLVNDWGPGISDPVMIWLAGGRPLVDMVLRQTSLVALPLPVTTRDATKDLEVMAACYALYRVSNCHRKSPSAALRKVLKKRQMTAQGIMNTDGARVDNWQRFVLRMEGLFKFDDQVKAIAYYIRKDKDLLALVQTRVQQRFALHKAGLGPNV